MSKIKLPPAAKLRRQIRPNGGYDMVPAYTTEEVIAIIEEREAGHGMKRRDAFRAGVASARRIGDLRLGFTLIDGRVHYCLIRLIGDVQTILMSGNVPLTELQDERTHLVQVREVAQ